MVRKNMWVKKFLSVDERVNDLELEIEELRKKIEILERSIIEIKQIIGG